MEMIVKMIALGFVLHKEAYLRNPWNQLDFTVVSLAWLPIFVPNMSGGVFSAAPFVRPRCVTSSGWRS